MIWDTYRCHIRDAVKEECSRLKLETAITPGGCTQYIQAADVVWNASFKSNMRQHYDTWLSEPSCHQRTKGGNLKAPSHGLICSLVKHSLEFISSETINSSFKSCEISTVTDGSDDDLLHYFQDVLKGRLFY
uniref:DDE-1 domain-containing protein n=1 Tax=Amphimedon queenslandica TaxID=400682 RepID=A0A1X7VQW2_AMPQE